MSASPVDERVTFVTYQNREQPVIDPSKELLLAAGALLWGPRRHDAGIVDGIGCASRNFLDSAHDGDGANKSNVESLT